MKPYTVMLQYNDDRSLYTTVIYIEQSRTNLIHTLIEKAIEQCAEGNGWELEDTRKAVTPMIILEGQHLSLI